MIEDAEHVIWFSHENKLKVLLRDFLDSNIWKAEKFQQ